MNELLERVSSLCAPGAQAVPSPYNDNRFSIIGDKSREIKSLLRELNKMSHSKFGELLGDIRTTGEDQKDPDPTCWADSIILEQNIAINIINDTLERIASV